jgi:signal transduction histidine kinase
MNETTSARLPRDSRAEIARQLHDGVAQTLAALACEITAAAHDCTDPVTAHRLRVLRALAGDAIEHATRLAREVHPAPHGDPFRTVLRPRVAP